MVGQEGPVTDTQSCGDCVSGWVLQASRFRGSREPVTPVFLPSSSLSLDVRILLKIQTFGREYNSYHFYEHKGNDS